MLPEAAKPVTIRRRLFQGLLPLHGHGLDVGAGRPPLPPTWRWWEHPTLRMRCTPWDIGDGDATLLGGVPDERYDWLTASHILEHLADPEQALASWLRVVRPGGWLLISVPHRQLYEQRHGLPSRWNANHLRFYLPYEDDGPDTVGLYQWLVAQPHRPSFKIKRLITGDWGHTNTADGTHPNGEYQIDALLQKSGPGG